MQRRQSVKFDLISDSDGSLWACRRASPFVSLIVYCLWAGLPAIAGAQTEELATPPISGPPPAAAPDEIPSPGYLGAILDDRDERGRGVRLIEVLTDGPAAQVLKLRYLCC